MLTGYKGFNNQMNPNGGFFPGQRGVGTGDFDNLPSTHRGALSHNDMFETQPNQGFNNSNNNNGNQLRPNTNTNNFGNNFSPTTPNFNPNPNGGNRFNFNGGNSSGVGGLAKDYLRSGFVRKVTEPCLTLRSTGF